MKIEDFIIHLGSNMSNDDRNHLQATLVALDGVISASFDDEQKLELVVTYNSVKTNPEIISETVTAWNLNAV